MESNRGGVREGAGRKPSNKKTVVVRVPVELLPMIEDAKLGIRAATNLQSATDNELVDELERRGLNLAAIQQAAKLMDVSVKLVLEAGAILKVSPEMFERIRAGEITVTAATKELKEKGFIK